MSLALFLRYLPLILGAGLVALVAGLGWRVADLTDDLEQARRAVVAAQATIEAWERIQDADISSGDAVADRDWLLNRGK